LLLVVDFSLAVLAGLGATVLGNRFLKEPGVRRRIAVVSVATLIVGGTGIRMLAVSTHTHTGWLRGPASSSVLLICGFTVIALRLAELVSPRVFAVLLLCVLSVDTVSFRSGILPFASRKEIFPAVPTFNFLKAHADPNLFRVGSVGATYLSNAEMVYGLAAADGYDLQLRLAQNFLTDFGLPTTGLNLNAEHIVGIKDRRLDLINVRYLVATTYNNSYEVLATRPDRFKLVFTDGAVRILENLTVLPRASFIPAVSGAVEVIPGDENQLTRLKDPAFDPEKSVILASPPPDWDQRTALNVEDVASTVSVASAGVNESMFKVFNPQPGLLVVSQIYYPGWLAYVDDREAPIIRADYALTAVPVSAGNHVIKLVFRPKSFRDGLTISLVSCALLAGLVVFEARKR
jgi:hypothetical protein